MSFYTFGKGSKAQLATVRESLRGVARRALGWGIMDLVVVQGRRSKEEQSRYFDLGKSKVEWPFSKHNVLNPGDEAKAFDIAPYVNGKISWDWKHCLVSAGIILAAAEVEGVSLRWGGNWDMDGEPITDQGFQDLVHFELVTK